MNKRQVGSAYESMAADYLINQGLTILDRNFRNRTGEIDLVASDGKYLVFIEVKYRADTHAGDPLEAITYRKQEQIRKVAAYYMMTHNYSEDTPVRFDCVGICGTSITWIKDAFHG